MLGSMRFAWWVVGFVVACGPGIAPRDSRDVARDVFVEADADSLEDAMRAGVVNGGLWFDDAQCASEFGRPGEVPAPRRGTFARCLAALGLQPSTRRHQLGDVVVLTYAPGFEVEARVVTTIDGPRLTWIGFASRRSGDLDVPTITRDALDRLRDGPAHAFAPPGTEPESAWVKLCLDATGAVVKTDIYELTSTTASDTAIATAREWKFRPFTLRGQPTPVCALWRMTSGSDAADEVLPAPPPPSRGKRAPLMFIENAKLIAGKRISGERNIGPDEHTLRAIERARPKGMSRDTKLVGTFRICLDASGVPESVLPLRSTGSAEYDAKIMTTMRTWRYSPYLVDGEAVPVCTPVTFVYRRTYR